MRTGPIVQRESAAAPRAPAIRRGFAWARGLNLLRRRTREHLAVAQVLRDHWNFQEDRPVTEMLDYGCGFGDISRTWSREAASEHPDWSPRVTVVDRDAQLRDFAREQFFRAGLPARRLTEERLWDQKVTFDRILLAHVLYYVANRERLVTDLVARSKPEGALTIVSRSEDCDAFALRSAVRKTEEEVRPTRLTVARQEAFLSDAGLTTQRTELFLPLSFDLDAVRLPDLLETTPSTDATELVRFLVHASPGRHDHQTLEVVGEQLAGRTRRGVVHLTLRSVVLTGRLPSPVGTAPDG